MKGGPRTEPWGTPQLGGAILRKVGDKPAAVSTAHSLSLRWQIKILWSTISNVKPEPTSRFYPYPSFLSEPLALHNRVKKGNETSPYEIGHRSYIIRWRWWGLWYDWTFPTWHLSLWPSWYDYKVIYSLYDGDRNAWALTICSQFDAISKKENLLCYQLLT